MAKKFDLATYKKTVEINQVEKKADKYIVLDECIQEVIGMPGNSTRSHYTNLR